VLLFARLHPAQKREAFRCDLLIRQNIFDREKFRFREKERLRQPVDETLVQQFLRAHARADHPERLRDLPGNDGDEKGPR
jgi:hypothetical protein